LWLASDCWHIWEPKVKAAIEDLKADKNFISVDEDFLELLVQFLGG